MSRRKSLAAKLSLGKLYRVPLREGAAESRHSRASGRRESGARGGGDGRSSGSGAQQRWWAEREEREEEEEVEEGGSGGRGIVNIFSSIRLRFLK